MGNKKKSDGVIATIERLTEQKPCPVLLRNCLNKYLYEEALFEGASRECAGKKKVQGKLIHGETDALVMNLLCLDQVFNGSTTSVVGIVSGEFEGKELEEILDRAGAELQRRFDTYGYWVQRMGKLKKILTNGSVDLKTERLDKLIKTPADTPVFHHQNPFALRALQQLERIEEKGRLGVPTVVELIEQSDAYLALGDVRRATEKACAALEVDKTNARAWFIRVMAVLRQRNAALRQMQRHETVAREVAETMSAHEAWAHEMASEEQDKAADYQNTLSKILPQALLHWPRASAGSHAYEHTNERYVVRDLFINTVFSKVAGLKALHRNYALNGLDAEWEFRFKNHEWGGMQAPALENEPAPLDEIELEALRLLLQERDRPYVPVNESIGKAWVGRELKLLHLRWTLKIDGYDKHWQQFKESISSSLPQDFETEVLQDQLLSRLWQTHAIFNDGYESANSLIADWVDRTMSAREELCYRHLLHHYALLYHHRYVRSDSSACIAISRRAQEVAHKLGARANYWHPMECPDNESVRMPIYRSLYWQYLTVLATLQISPAEAGEEYISTVLNAESLSESFREARKCFWYESDECDDYETPPYDVDLRDTEPWLKAAKLVLAQKPDSPNFDLLASLISRLEVAERPFAPRECPPFEEEDPECSD